MSRCRRCDSDQLRGIKARCDPDIHTDLCDVCYWKTLYEDTKQELDKMKFKTIPASKCEPGKWYQHKRSGRVLCCGTGNPDAWLPAFAVRNEDGRTVLRYFSDLVSDSITECDQSW